MLVSKEVFFVSLGTICYQKSVIKSQLRSGTKQGCSALGRNSEVTSPVLELCGEKIAPRGAQKLSSYEEEHRHQIAHLYDSSPCFG